MGPTRRETLGGLAAMAGLATVPALAQAAPLPRGLRDLGRTKEMAEVAFKDATGRDIGFVELRGKPSVAMFWATWCTVCYDEMPKLDALQAKLGSRAHIVPLSIDQAGMPAVKAYYRRRELKVLKPYLDDERIFASIMGIRGVPTGFVLDRQGNMVAASEGPVDWDSPVASQFLTSL